MTDRATVLVVDDDGDLRGLVRAVLAPHPRLDVVAEAGDGQSALALAEQHCPDIVVLDLGLPDISGHDVLTQLRERLPGVRVVVHTGNVPAKQQAIEEWGADRVVVKGDDLARLIGALEDVVPDAAASAVTEFAPDAVSAREARMFVDSCLDRWRADGLIDTAELVVSELVTNAVVHARTRCRLALRYRDDTLRIEVTDYGGGSPEPQPPSTTREGGRGLLIVSALAKAWGIDPAPGGKVVWAELGS